MTSYDRIDWHLDRAIEAGQPEEHAFTHIGLYLAWVIRHDADWVEGGRTAPRRQSEAAPTDLDIATTSSTVMIPPGSGPEQISELLAHLPSDVQELTSDAPGPRSHVAPELEALIPIDLTSPPMEIESRSATKWGSSLLSRGLKRLGLSAKDAVVVHAIGGDGHGR